MWIKWRHLWNSGADVWHWDRLRIDPELDPDGKEAREEAEEWFVAEVRSEHSWNFEAYRGVEFTLHLTAPVEVVRDKILAKLSYIDGAVSDIHNLMLWLKDSYDAKGA